MKLPLKITGAFLIFALLTSCVVATENKDLPTKEEITDFVAGISVSDDYINAVFNAVVDKQPTWNCDIWKDKKTGNQVLSLYYVDPDSKKGYGSIYFNELGKEISKQGLELDPKPVKHRVGKVVSKENTDNTVQTAKTVQTTEEEVQSIDNATQSVDDKTQSVDYWSKSDKSAYTPYEDDSQPVDNAAQSVDNAAQSVDNAAQSVKNAAQSVEDVAKKVENEEETKWYKKISTDVFVGVLIAFIACMLRLNH